ncbi:gas vesicle protein [Candidatus Jettenia sp. AMX1]|uniref:gas vesicle protein n=1 Tax=Candidatus Jettenia sp. AMX1 TaxID=2293637 RepID=UPI00058C2259
MENQHISLCETLDRVLNTGVVIHGDITISVANIDLIYIGLKALLTSVETARQAQSESSAQRFNRETYK